MTEAEGSTYAVIVAAGRGVRAGGELPKQWQDLAGARVFDHALAAFADHPAINGVLAVIHPDDAGLLPDNVDWVAGGETRAASVRAGLEALKGKGVGRVLIHDAARPCLDAATIDAVIAALKAHDGAAPALAVTDALWRTEGGASITGIRDRADTARAQTPQGFRFEAILSAHRAARGDEPDDIAVALAAGLDLAAVPGDEDNIKITQPGDLARAARILGGDVDIRTGNGFDVHRFGPGDHVMLCGLRVAHDRGLQGHSDADVGMHALTDAIYGALAAGDIGRHFPTTDAKWRASDSAIFLAHAISLVRERGYELSHADVTLICEQPKIGPHVQAMRERLAAITGAPVERISVKATTTERLGFTGRGEGIAAQATATLVRI